MGALSIPLTNDFYLTGYGHGVGSWIATGTYTGTGVASTAITGVGFQPDMVIVKRYPNVKGMACTSMMPAGESKEIQSSSALLTNNIESLDTDGFTVGTDSVVNSGTVVYHWAAFTDTLATASGKPRIIQWVEVDPYY